MRMTLHIPTARAPASCVATLLSARRRPLRRKGILFPLSVGRHDHGRLLLAALAPDSPYPGLESRGLTDTDVHRMYSIESRDALGKEITEHRPDRLLLSFPDAAQTFPSADALAGFWAFLSEFGQNIDVILHHTCPAEELLDYWLFRVFNGRTELPGAEDIARIDPTALKTRWDAIFDPAQVKRAAWHHEEAFKTKWIAFRKELDLDGSIGFPEKLLPSPTIIGQTALRRVLSLNLALRPFEAAHGPVPHKARAALVNNAMTAGPPGPPLLPAHMAGLTRDLEQICPDPDPAPLPDLTPDPEFKADAPLKDLERTLPEMREKLRARRSERRARAKTFLASLEKPKKESTNKPKKGSRANQGPEFSPSAAKLFSPATKEVYENLRKTRFCPKNEGVVSFDESAPLPPLSADRAPRTNTLLIACMKNEAPYILEWIAYHLSIGVGHFLIFSNDCSDGTDDLLDRLTALGIVTHERNDTWKGKSPQQAALNKAMSMQVVADADWLIHIDVDEYINIRLGDGSLSCLLEAMGDATNLAMTWRLFGNKGEMGIEDGRVLSRFDRCAPAWAPKPHTLWGFKSITRNIGVYGKLSCHRPNKPVEEKIQRIHWLNGSLQDMTQEATKSGVWRNTTKSIGYDAIQLNHYALRSRDSFLVKRQRGRALHVDRTIGANYWIRHDWHLHKDVSIQRHLARMQSVLDELKTDPELLRLHQSGLDWHHAKAEMLHHEESFQELITEIDNVELTDMERVAWAVAQDMES